MSSYRAGHVTAPYKLSYHYYYYYYYYYYYHYHYHYQYRASMCWRKITRSSAVAERPRTASCLSVVSFNIPTAQFFCYQLLRLQVFLVHKIYYGLALGYPMVKNVRRYRYSFYATHERVRQTDRQTPHDSIGRPYASHRAAKTSSASHGNFDSFVVFMCLCRSKIF